MEWCKNETAVGCSGVGGVAFPAWRDTGCCRARRRGLRSRGGTAGAPPGAVPPGWADPCLVWQRWRVCRSPGPRVSAAAPNACAV